MSEWWLSQELVNKISFRRLEIYYAILRTDYLPIDATSFCFGNKKKINYFPALVVPVLSRLWARHRRPRGHGCHQSSCIFVNHEDRMWMKSRINAKIRIHILVTESSDILTRLQLCHQQINSSIIYHQRRKDRRNYRYDFPSRSPNWRSMSSRITLMAAAHCSSV